ncbi:MAG TPA: vitamin B12 dependent-methionine synthase activation domain-containing protein, partial [Anaerolineales bacterium]|nr:vitamin B12 dependent-methionine synthase activation domain-containing protein [Anaerolineales bacterium]
PAHITPYAEIPDEERELAEDLIFNRRPDALQRFIEYFESIGADTTQAGSAVSDPTEGMTPQERLHWRILHRHKEGVETDIDEILAQKLQPNNGQRDNLPNIPLQHEAAVEILNTVLLPAMKEVGDKFGSGELILPFVLQSAEVMKKAVSYLEGFLDRKGGTSKGKVVLATVYGDVHDIGKNLVKTILANNGFEVVDLGKQVPAETIISRAEEQCADAIGLSALLVNTSKQMPLIVDELHRRGLEIPVLVGGAAINRRFGYRILFTEDDTPYKAGVFYCKDAFEGLTTMEALTNPEERKQLQTNTMEQAQRELNRSVRRRDKDHPLPRSKILPAPSPPSPPSWGSHVVRTIPLETVFQYLSKNELFRLSWGAKNARGEDWERLRAEFEERLENMQRQALQEGWLKPQAVYGYWPAQSDGDDLIIFDPSSIFPNLQAEDGPGMKAEIARFTFPRQPSGDHLCLADYFTSLESDHVDVVALQVVTVGHQATERFDRLEAAGDYSEAYYTHGLAVQTAEATTKYLHRHIRQELGLPESRGKRYSWGYPAIPNLEDHGLVFDLLPAEKELGMSLTAAYQMVPEQSTAAIVVHHPDARYFNIGESRLEQLIK